MMTYGYMSDDGQRWGAMNAVAANGGMSVVHAEDDAIANWLTAQYVREGKTHGAYICEVRGPIVEEAAIRRAMLLAERAGSPLYILHMAAGSGIAALAEARASGLPFYGETLSAYLSFTQDDLWDESPVEVDGTVYNAARAALQQLPDAEVQDPTARLLAALVSGELQAVATDHALVSLKRPLRDDGDHGGQHAGRPGGGRAARPAALQRGREKRAVLGEPLGRADLDEPGEAHGPVAAQGPARPGRRRRRRRLRPEPALDRALAGPAHGRRRTTAGTGGS